MSSKPRILYCHCQYAQVVPPEVKEAVLRKLAESGVAFDAVADLCELSARQDSSLKGSADGVATLTALLEKGFAVTRTVAGGRVAPHEGGSLLVFGQFTGGGSLAAGGVPAGTPARFHDITGLDTNRIAELAESTRAELG